MQYILIAVVCIIASVSAFTSVAHQKSGFIQRLSKTSLAYSVKIVNNKRGEDITIDIPGDQIILDYSESQGITSIPYSCRAGKLKSGEVDQTGNIFLSEEQMDDGFVLTCIATAMSDLEIEVDVEDLFYAENPEISMD